MTDIQEINPYVCFFFSFCTGFVLGRVCDIFGIWISGRILFADIGDVKLMLYLYKFSLLFAILNIFLHQEQTEVEFRVRRNHTPLLLSVRYKFGVCFSEIIWHSTMYSVQTFFHSKPLPLMKSFLMCAHYALDAFEKLRLKHQNKSPFRSIWLLLFFSLHVIG